MKIHGKTSSCGGRTSQCGEVHLVRTSTTRMMTSALSMASWACRRICVRITSSAPGSMPPVSTRRKGRFSHSHSAKIRSLVTPRVLQPGGRGAGGGFRLPRPRNRGSAGSGVFHPSPDAGSVDEHILPVVVLHDGIHCVTGGARNVGDDQG